MPPVDRLPFATKLWFGIGQAAEGMKNSAFTAFLLLFYSQVLGLPAYLGGIALAVSLAVDAITDPLAGSLSDACRHRWGRRHPFMYASAVPLGVSFAMVFSPPAGLSTAGLFAWMLLATVLTRLAMTLYHVPHLALGAELSADYHERTIVVAYRNFFGLLGAAALFLLARWFFLVPTPEHPAGELDPSAYPPLGIFFGALMAVLILASAIGTHSRIPYLPAGGHAAPFTPRRLGGEMREALANRSFRALFLGLLIFFVARGIDTSLSIYMGTFFWRLDTGHVLLIPAFGIAGVVVGTPLWALVARRVDKRRIFFVGVWWYSSLAALLPVLRIVGLYPSPESGLYIPLLYFVVLLAAVGAAGALVSAGSMLADVADEHELDVGRRQEGIFFGALSFSGKAAAGLGSAIAGFALSLIDFPLKVSPELVPSAAVTQLGLLAGPGTLVLMLVGIVLMRGYALTRERVAQVQNELARRRSSTAVRATS